MSPSANSTSVGLLSQKEYARRKGWSKQYVNQLVKQGRIPLMDGRIDPAAADAALAGMRDPSRGSQFRGDAIGEAKAESPPNPRMDPAPGIQGTFAKARTIREHFRAMREQMEFEAAKGELISRREIEDESYEIGVMFREHMMGASELIAAQIADRFKVDPADAEELIASGIAQALQRLGEHIRNELGFDRGLPNEGGKK